MVGSFVLAVVTTIRIIVEWIKNQHKANDNQNAGVKAMMKCLECCL
jgi:solute carrier family 44 protein 1 (choline transporter-like protein)